MIKPISPNEVAAQKVKNLPDAVIECWNAIIARKYNYGVSIVPLNEVASELSFVTNKTRNEITNLGYLDIEEIYRDVGWSVKFDRPAYNENYEATYTFKKK